MGTVTTEQALRQEAIRRRLQNEKPGEICRALNRSPRWLHKWWATYQRHPQTDFADGSRAPHTSPQQTPPAIEQAVVTARRTLEAGATPATKYGLIGAAAIRQHLTALGMAPLPSAATIQRILARHGLTQPLGAGQATAYYPWPEAWGVNVMHATDIITRHVQGGLVIQNFHTLDFGSYAVHLTQATAKTCTVAVNHFLDTWATLGWPLLQQLDNEAAFSGGPRYARCLGTIVRLCLYCGIEPVFTPFYEPQRNYQIENFHGLWVKSFWQRERFTDLAHVQREIATFLRWYHRRYQPPALAGQTPAQARRGAVGPLLTPPLRRLLPTTPLPLTQGRLHFLRQVAPSGHIEVLNERWWVGARWGGEYVRATLNTAHQTLTIWHQAETAAAWRLLKTRSFTFTEPVQPVVLAFRRNTARCRDYWPD